MTSPPASMPRATLPASPPRWPTSPPTSSSDRTLRLVTHAGDSMTSAADRAPRRRADAARNREAVLQAATEVFARSDTEPSMRALAREAGVGIATLYRHFPTRE